MGKRLIELSKNIIPSSFSLPKEGKLLLAFSGGSDSLFLLSLLSILAPERTTALYVNHRLRDKDELKKEEELNIQNATLLSIPLVIIRLDEGEITKDAKKNKCGLEAEARRKRYAILFDYAEKNNFDYILTAHHSQDQIETVIMRMLSASPIWKYEGIREKNGKILRPLLDVDKTFINRALLSLGLSWSEDTTNNNTSYLRNDIRQNIIPKLTDREKRLILSISKNVKELNKAEDDIPFYAGFYCSFSRTMFLASSPRQRERLVFNIFNHLGTNERITRRSILEFTRGVERGIGRGDMFSFIIYYDKESVRVYRRIEAFTSTYPSLDIPGLEISQYSDDPLALVIPSGELEGAIFRLSRCDDIIELVDGFRRVSDFKKEYRVPYVLVAEKNNRIIALFCSFLGGRDRLSSTLKGRGGEKVVIVPQQEKDIL